MAQRKPSPAGNEEKAPKQPKDEATLTHLYLLRDPDTGAIRYAGKANDPAARLKTHIRDARRRHAPLQQWIRLLAQEGKAPALSVLCAVPRPQWEAAERALIAALREMGVNLLNLAAGGNEPKRPEPTHMAENGRRTARAVHGDPLARRRWELRKEAGTTLRWLEQRGDLVRAAKLRAALARLDAKGAACP